VSNLWVKRDNIIVSSVSVSASSVFTKPEQSLPGQPGWVFAANMDRTSAFLLPG